MENPQFERYKLVTMEVLKSLGGIADTRQLATTVLLSLDDVPPDDPEYDYDSLSMIMTPCPGIYAGPGKLC